MGANISNEVNTSITQNLVDQSTKILNETAQYTTNTVTASQIIDASFNNATIKNCDLDFKQDMKVVNKVYSKLDAAAQADLTNKLQNTIKNSLQATVEQKAKDLVFGLTNVSDINNFTSTYNYSDMSSKLSNSIISSFNSSIDASQSQKLNFDNANIDCSDKGRIYVLQNVDLDNVIENAVDSVQNTEVANDYKAEVTNLVVAASKQTLEGINPMFFLFFLLIIPIGIIFVVWKVYKGLWRNPFTVIKGWFSKNKKSAFGRRRGYTKSFRRSFFGKRF